MRLLLIDDDEVLSETLAQRLIGQRYAVDTAATGEMACEFIALFSYDLIVLDMSLPDADGLTLCQQFREEGITSPILMLSANDDQEIKVKTLDSGANDYVVKPFDFEELFARVRVLLRRDQPGSTLLEWAGLSLNPVTLDVFFDGHEIHLTPKEYAMLELFLRNPSRVFSLDAIIDNLWSFEDPPSGDAVRTHVKGLRQKLKAKGAPKDFIETVYGLGYRLKAPLENQKPKIQNDTPQLLAPKSTHPKISPSSAAVSIPRQAEISAAVARAWTDHQDLMQERLSVLEATAAALDVGRLSRELQHAGRTHAHKLAGSLGCFGFAEGSRLARELEHLLDLDAPLNDQHASRVSSLLQDLRQQLAQGSSDPIVSASVNSRPQVLMVCPAIAPEPTQVPELMQELIASTEPIDIHSLIATTLGQARALLAAEPIRAAVLWVSSETFLNSLSLLDEIAALPRPMPVLTICDLPDFQHRLKLVQKGADRILPTTTDAAHLVKDLQGLLQIIHGGQIVVVDDDVQTLQLVETLLSPWGFQTTTLNNPADLWPTLENLSPSLLILDIEMPEVSGLELCRVLRADARWRQLPILFLSIHEDTKTYQQAFSAGADDFINKATVTRDLPSRVINRLRRAQL